MSAYLRKAKAYRSSFRVLSIRQMYRHFTALISQRSRMAAGTCTMLSSTQPRRSQVRVLVIEWTHGNSDFIEGVDIPVLLNSTPAETLAHRRARNRDGKTDSAFTTMVLELEQQKLDAQAHKAKLILSKAGELMDYREYRRRMADA